MFSSPNHKTGLGQAETRSHASLVSWILFAETVATKPTNRYRMKLATRPMLTQSVTTAILFATGDIMAQQAVERKGIEKHEFVRTGRMALYGGGKTSKG